MEFVGKERRGLVSIMLHARPTTTRGLVSTMDCKVRIYYVVILFDYSRGCRVYSLRCLVLSIFELKVSIWNMMICWKFGMSRSEQVTFISIFIFIAK